MAKLITEFTDGDVPVRWEFDGLVHVITYGRHSKQFQFDLDAAHEFGECVGHSLHCAGKFDPEGQDNA